MCAAQNASDSFRIAEISWGIAVSGDESCYRVAETQKEKGPLVDERPKSREETPKEGCGTSRLIPTRHNSDMGAFVVQCNCGDPTQDAFRHKCSGFATHPDD
jgi:hypothetical protein